MSCVRAGARLVLVKILCPVVTTRMKFDACRTQRA